MSIITLGGITMNSYIKKIYDMMYSPIITPYNLLENAKLDNYGYVKYYTNKMGIVAEMQCEIPGEGVQIFYYQFDDKDYLQRIYQNTMTIEGIIFSRDEAIESAKKEYYDNKLSIEEYAG